MFNFVYEFLDKIGYHHPIHPTEVHMPIGLIVGALVFVLAVLIFHREKLVLTPRHCTILAFIWVFPTMLLGYMDWQHFYGGSWLLPVKAKLVLAPLLAVLLFLGMFFGHKFGATAKLTVTFYVLSFFTVVALGYFGGQMVYGSKSPATSEQYKGGEKTFKTNCSACHPHGGNTIRPDLPLRTAPQLKDPASFMAFIRSPKTPDGTQSLMPPFGTSKISEQQGRELYEYIVQALLTKRPDAESSPP